MKGLKSAFAILVVTAIAITAGAGSSLASGEPPWEAALIARSEALNKQHGLGGSRLTVNTGSPSWMRAVMIRSEALNREYGLGKFSRKLTSVQTEAWLRALVIRSDALNQQYKLGEYAPRS